MTRRRPRGFALILVLAVLLVLSIVAASTYASSADTEVTSSVVMSQRLAATRADQAVQLAIAQVKAGMVNPTNINNLLPCSGIVGHLHAPVGPVCTSAVTMTSGTVLGTAANDDFSEGAGMQYQWWIYRRSLPDGGTNSANQMLVNIYAEGYYGSAPTSNNFAVSAVEAEMYVEVPAGMDLAADFDYGLFR